MIEAGTPDWRLRLEFAVLAHEIIDGKSLFFMQISPPPQVVEPYNPALRTLHWLLAAVIFSRSASGSGRRSCRMANCGPKVLVVLKSFGVAALALVALRVVVRLLVSAPAYAAPVGRLVAAAAGSPHLVLYALMIAMPAGGYVTSSAGGHEVSLFGLFTLPILVPRDKALGEAASQAHFVFASAIGIVLALHFVAVVWHAHVKRDMVLARMWPRGLAVR